MNRGVNEGLATSGSLLLCSNAPLALGVKRIIEDEFAFRNFHDSKDHEKLLGGTAQNACHCCPVL